MMCHKQQYYFETAKVLPTLEDGTSVLLFSISLQTWVDVSVHTIMAYAEYYKEKFSHWMQLPKAPSPSDAHAFLG